MEQIEERLITEVRKYEHLYNSSCRDYKDSKMTYNSWREIAHGIGLDAAECMKRWKNLRDKYVRRRKKMACRSEDADDRRAPAFYEYLSWLEPHVKHREESKLKSKMTPHRTLDSDLRSPSASEPPSPPTPTPSTQPMSPLSTAPSVPAQSHTSRVRARKRKRVDEDDVLSRQMTQLEERRLELQQKLGPESDECSRFGQTVGDMLRRVPESKRADVMYMVFTTLYEHRLKPT
ncbi:uncharacterized protein LOC115405610 [Salarias fasciatus]|uniref:uncharacterized protein LOC115405610 n=1 Tax=Salarias fasciatus TaxID=181472 RepID=UPI001176D72F|nr:uncharacterized protein LOC115405610 [Salarias fasciatus]XP_029971094.1 uncharacterized protein LOC115405610 [Salarias fasciatus]